MTVEIDNTDKLKVLLDDAKLVRHQLRAARRQPRRAPLRAGRRRLRALRPGRDQGHRAGRDRGHRRCARRRRRRGRRAVSQPVRLLRARRPPAHQQARRRGADQGRRVRRAARRPGRCAGQRRRWPSTGPTRRPRTTHQVGLFDFGDSHAASTQEPALVAAEPLGRARAADAREDRARLLPVGPPVRAGRGRGAAVLHAAHRRPGRRREPQLLAGIVSELRMVNGQRGRVADLQARRRQRGRSRRCANEETARRAPRAAARGRAADRAGPGAARPLRRRAAPERRAGLGPGRRACAFRPLPVGAR